MSWFSVGVPVLLQLLVPLGLLAAVVKARFASRATFVGMTILAAAYIVAIHRAGLWLVLPWFTPFAYAAALLTVVLTTQTRWRAAPWRPATRSAQALTIAIGATALILITLAVVAWSARDWSGDTVDLALPFEDGEYLVVNGGSHVLVNAHLATLNGNRFAAYRGQSYGVDLVRIDFLGLRARGLLPADPAAYRTFDEPVLAPCAGRVVAAVDGFPDMPPPQVDRTHMAGNHVIVECQQAWVVLGHLRRDSVEARAGLWLRTGERVGRAGNSGNTGEPHLHMHAQRPGTDDAPLGGAPLPIRIAGRFPIRNDRLP